MLRALITGWLDGVGRRHLDERIVVADRVIHTVHKNGEWINEVEGGERIEGSFATKEVAASEGRLQAIEATTEHVIHNADGTIAERNSYGPDPASRLG